MTSEKLYLKLSNCPAYIAAYKQLPSKKKKITALRFQNLNFSRKNDLHLLKIISLMFI